MIDHVVDDPQAVRELARRNGPYRFPDRPGGFVWPTWHSQRASDGELHLEAARHLFEHQRLLDAAAEMAGTGRVRPRGVYVNLSTPFIAQPVSHTDQPEFRGVEASIAPGWFLQSMGASGLFEAERCEVFTAVAWFFAGEASTWTPGSTWWCPGSSPGPSLIEQLTAVAERSSATFIEISLDLERDAAADAFHRRSSEPTNSTHRDAMALIAQSADDNPLAAMHDALAQLLATRPHVHRVAVRRGDIDATLDAVLDALRIAGVEW